MPSAWSIDARIPVLFGPATMAGPDDAVLGEPAAGAAAMPGHPPACACCVPRSGAAQALAALFLARARGDVPFFRRVVVTWADPAPIRAALADDALVAGRFRLA